MRFEYEPLTTQSILRRVIEHERTLGNGKRVSTVVLTKAEWFEFLNNEAKGMYWEPKPEFAKYNIRRPPVLTMPNDPYPYLYETTITVRPE